VQFRRNAFDGEPNMFPLRTEGGDVGIVADVTHIRSAGRSDKTVIAEIAEAVRNRPAPVPYSTHRLARPLEFEPN
jgi:hypothetical protein